MEDRYAIYELVRFLCRCETVASVCIVDTETGKYLGNFCTPCAVLEQSRLARAAGRPQLRLVTR